MKVLENIIDIDLKCETGEHLIINGINGLVDVINSFEYIRLQEWKQSRNLPKEFMADPVFAKLMERGYIVADTYDEEQKREELFQSLSMARRKALEECKKVSFILTYGCNFSCPYCYEKGIESRKTLTKEQVDKIFAFYNNDIEDISFFGGEPLLLSNKSIIDYIIKKAPEARYSIITNGFYLEEYYDIFKNLDITNIQVTLDGEQEIHNKTRVLRNGQGTFEKIYAGVRLYAKNRIPITIRMNIHSENIDSCVQLKSKIKSEDWSGGIRFEMQKLFQIEQSEKKKLWESLMEEDAQAQHENEILKRQGVISNFLYSGQPLRPVLKVCGADYMHRFYDPEGDVYSCILSVGNKKKRVATYNDELVYENKSMLKRDVTTIPKCRDCKYAILCGGGCPNAIAENYDIMNTPNCEAFLREIQETVPFIYKQRYGKK